MNERCFNVQITKIMILVDDKLCCLVFFFRLFVVVVLLLAVACWLVWCRKSKISKILWGMPSLTPHLDATTRFLLVLAIYLVKKNLAPAQQNLKIANADHVAGSGRRSISPRTTYKFGRAYLQLQQSAVGVVSSVTIELGDLSLRTVRPSRSNQ